MNPKELTITTYDAAAEAMAAHFQTYNVGVAEKEIKQSFKSLKNPEKARVVEIGCGAGKEAAYLLKHVGWYEGFDPSAKLLEIAKRHAPTGSFVLADASSYSYPYNIDAVFAFASMLHIDKAEFASVCSKVARSLKPGGVFCITLKEADSYGSKLQEDKFGKRLFYFYNPQLVVELAGPEFSKVFEEHQTVGPEKKRWFTIILKKK